MLQPNHGLSDTGSISVTTSTENTEEQLSYRYGVDISEREAQQAAEWSEKEESLANLEASEVMDMAANGWIGLYNEQDELVGCIFMTRYTVDDVEFYERGMLYIGAEYRKKGLGGFLMQSMTDYNRGRPIVSITEVESVIENNEALGMVQRKKISKLPDVVLDTLEEKGKIDGDYQLRVNDVFLEMIQGYQTDVAAQRFAADLKKTLQENNNE